jgi:hypothetical protein
MGRERARRLIARRRPVPRAIDLFALSAAPRAKQPSLHLAMPMPTKVPWERPANVPRSIEIEVIDEASEPVGACAIEREAMLGSNERRRKQPLELATGEPSQSRRRLLEKVADTSNARVAGAGTIVKSVMSNRPTVAVPARSSGTRKPIWMFAIDCITAAQLVPENETHCELDGVRSKWTCVHSFAATPAP